MARVRLKDVAADCGVSTATVSLVLNDATDRITPDTVARVKASAARLGYTPNSVARSLRARRSHTIGVITDALLTSEGAGRMIHGAQDVAWAHDHLLFWLETENRPDLRDSALEALTARQADGLVFAAVYHRRLDFAAETAGIPTVGLNAVSDDASVPCFVPDDHRVGREAARHLLDRGHRRIAHLSDPATDGLARQLRADGFHAELAVAGVGEARVLVPPPGQGGTQAAEHAALEALAGPDRPTAVFAFNDAAALGVYRAAARLGLRIPEDLSVVGCDDHPYIATELRPTLTTFELPFREMGRRALSTLLARLGVIEEDVPEGVTRLGCPLVTRGSMAAPAE